ncbi:MAG: anhydro-N-acetylmuramic acid kinase, partial [Brachymonas sp.]|nr:anhydro-N-acetylmuramic acid kinase [Brachymonas sp.]
MVINSAERGLPPQEVEATAFAWLAKQCVERVALPLTSVTGARGSRVLGGIYPA